MNRRPPTVLELLTLASLSGRDYRVRLSPEDLARAEHHRAHGYEEHASYPIMIDLPLCGLCGEVAIRCPHDAVHALPIGVPFSPAPNIGSGVSQDSTVPEIPPPAAVLDERVSLRDEVGSFDPAAVLEAWVEGHGTATSKECRVGVVMVRSGVAICEASSLIGPGGKYFAEVKAIHRALILAYALNGGRQAPLHVFTSSEPAISALTSRYLLVRDRSIASAAAVLRDELTHWKRVSFHCVGEESNLRWNDRALDLSGGGGFVYFVQLGDGGPIKIGYAVDVRRRLKILQTASPEKLKLRLVLKGGVALESRLHRRFKAEHSNGEWFHPSTALLEFIESSKRAAA